MLAKVFLAKLKKIDTFIKNKEEEKEQWRAMVDYSSPVTDNIRVQTSTTSDSLARDVLMYIEQIEKINVKIQGYIDEKERMVEILEMLPADDYDVLHKLYVQKYDIRNTASLCQMSESWVNSKHGRAIQKLDQLLKELEWSK